MCRTAAAAGCPQGLDCWAQPLKMPLIPSSLSKQQTLPHFAGLQRASRGMRERTFHLLPKEWGPTCCCPDRPNSSSGGTRRWSSPGVWPWAARPRSWPWRVFSGPFSCPSCASRLRWHWCLSWDLSVLKSPDQLFYGDTDKFLLIIHPVLIDFLFFLFLFPRDAHLATLKAASLIEILETFIHNPTQPQDSSFMLPHSV